MRDIVLCLQDKNGTYSKNIAAVIVSVIKNTQEQLCFHIFHDASLSKENRVKLAKVCADLQQKILFHNIVLPVQETEFNAIKYISMGTLYRLDIANQLADVEKALYLDGDIIVNLDIAELFSFDMKGKAILAVKDKGVEKNPKLYKLNIPVKLDNYFNAGVILFDLEKIRKTYNLLADCLTIIKQYPKDFFTDQSALNHFLQDDCLLIDEKYNLFPNKENDDLKKRCIWHFAGGGKPWSTRQFKVDKFYWDYLKLTPWGAREEDLFALYAQTVEPLEIALLKYPIGSRKQYFKSVLVRTIREIRKLFNQFA